MRIFMYLNSFINLINCINLFYTMMKSLSQNSFKESLIQNTKDQTISSMRKRIQEQHNIICWCVTIFAVAATVAFIIILF
jgi:hypothetical protein